MQLNQKQLDALIIKLNEVWPSPRHCSACKKTNWNINDRVFELREFHGGGMVIGGNSSVIPVINASCANCGHTIYFNAIILGVIPGQQKQPSNEISSDGVAKNE